MKKSNKVKEKPFSPQVIEEINTILSEVEEKIDPDLLQGKGFYLIVRQPFENYKRGDSIFDCNEIERITDKGLLNLVIKVNNK